MFSSKRTHSPKQQNRPSRGAKETWLELDSIYYLYRMCSLTRECVLLLYLVKVGHHLQDGGVDMTY